MLIYCMWIYRMLIWKNANFKNTDLEKCRFNRFIREWWPCQNLINSPFTTASPSTRYRTTCGRAWWGTLSGTKSQEIFSPPCLKTTWSTPLEGPTKTTWPICRHMHAFFTTMRRPAGTDPRKMWKRGWRRGGRFNHESTIRPHEKNLRNSQLDYSCTEAVSGQEGAGNGLPHWRTDLGEYQA